MGKRFFISWIILFVLWMIGSFVVHGMLLKADYAAMPNLMRTEADSMKYFPLMLLAHVILSGAFAWIYARGVEPKPWLPQGVRFGVAIALLTSCRRTSSTTSCNRCPVRSSPSRSSSTGS